MRTRRQFLQTGVASAAAASLLPHQNATAETNARADDTGEALWYLAPAERWLEALPLGNGRLGAMVSGGVSKERISLSESTAWSGAPATGQVNPDALPNLSHIREAFFAGHYDDSQSMCEKYLPGNMHNVGTNLPLPYLEILFDGHEADQYRRSLSLDEAIARVSYRHNGALYEREVFATHAHNVLIIRLSSSSANRTSASVRFGEGVIPFTVETAWFHCEV